MDYPIFLTPNGTFGVWHECLYDAARGHRVLSYDVIVGWSKKMDPDGNLIGPPRRDDKPHLQHTSIEGQTAG